MDEFRNESPVDLTRPENREKMQAAIRSVRGMADREWPLFIAGREVQTESRFSSFNPAAPTESVGSFARAGVAEAEAALDAAWEAFPAWRDTRPRDRAQLLFAAARILRDRRFEMDAAMVLEVGKSWAEAEADTSEAIDFLEFYGREAIRYGEDQPVTRIPSERSTLRYIPLGAGVVIPPWNFPCAILTGMTAGAIAAGNTVVLKPSSDAALVANLCLQVLIDAGLPAGVVNLVTGPGSVAGETLVAHPRTRFVAFTGSMEVGLRINELAARHAPGQRWIKRVIAEMGGKNGIIVDETADLDAAAAGVVASAYGFQGQKCSACSRAIVLDSVYDAFVEKLLARTRAIRMGDPADPEVFLGPVINQAAVDKILGYIEIGKKEGRLLTGGQRAAGAGFFIEPTIFEGIRPEHRLAREEIFGPVLALLRVKDFDEALDVANDTDFGLTGSVYSTDRRNLDRAMDRFHVGNLYLNRKSTGALVGVHPFGGFNLSGTDSKAGGRDYLLLFLQAKSISEAIAGR